MMMTHFQIKMLCAHESNFYIKTFLLWYPIDRSQIFNLCQATKRKFTLCQCSGRKHKNFWAIGFYFYNHVFVLLIWWTFLLIFYPNPIFIPILLSLMRLSENDLNLFKVPPLLLVKPLGCFAEISAICSLRPDPRGSQQFTESWTLGWSLSKSLLYTRFQPGSHKIH